MIDGEKLELQEENTQGFFSRLFQRDQKVETEIEGEVSDETVEEENTGESEEENTEEAS